MDRDAVFAQDYEAWGQQTNFQRDAHFTWHDGSSWHDGKSQLPPDLPLTPKQSPQDKMTCAQEEILWLMTFPASERLSPSGTEQAEQNRITRRWETAFAAKVWNEQANTSTPAGIADFEVRCGDLPPPM